MRIATATVAVALIALCTSARAAEELVTLAVRDGVTESYLLVYDKASTPQAVAVTLIGGKGAIDFPKRMHDGAARFGAGANFLIRIRSSLAGSDIADAIVDAPSDRLPDGMTDDFRSGEIGRASCRERV